MNKSVSEIIYFMRCQQVVDKLSQSVANISFNCVVKNEEVRRRAKLRFSVPFQFRNLIFPTIREWRESFASTSDFLRQT